MPVRRAAVQCNNYNQVQVLYCETAHGVYVTKRDTGTAVIPTQSSSTMCAYINNFSVAQKTPLLSSTLVHAFTVEQKRQIPHT